MQTALERNVERVKRFLWTQTDALTAAEVAAEIDDGGEEMSSDQAKRALEALVIARRADRARRSGGKGITHEYKPTALLRREMIK